MQFIQSDHSNDSCLRFVFDDAVVSFDLAVDATFEDIARVLGELMSRHRGNPIAIDVTLAGPGRWSGHHNGGAFVVPASPGSLV